MWPLVRNGYNDIWVMLAASALSQRGNYDSIMSGARGSVLGNWRQSSAEDDNTRALYQISVVKFLIFYSGIESQGGAISQSGILNLEKRAAGGESRDGGMENQLPEMPKLVKIFPSRK